MKVVALLASLHAVMCASVIDRASSGCPQICPYNYDPVCDTNGISYSNQCMLDSAICMDSSIRLSHHGACALGKRAAGCSVMICPAIYSPVCGSDSITYSSECMMHASCKPGIFVVARTPCDNVPIS